MANLNDLSNLGQAIWLDYIRRYFLTSGELSSWVEKGLRGVTSNPSIFERAIAGSQDYDQDLEALIARGFSANEIYESLVFKDIRQAAGILRSVYEKTNGKDGFVSLEVSPFLANNTEETVSESRRLFRTLDRPNVMIKIPATPAGIYAINTLTGEGININVTLIFSIEHYEAAAEAYITGLEHFLLQGGDLTKVASVASFFISRVDAAVDKILEALGEDNLRGKIAIANAKVAYQRFGELFSGKRWDHLAEAGANVQRPLWASTGTKNPQYSDTLYVDSLIGQHTVNTLPPATLNAYLDHGKVEPSINLGMSEARSSLIKLDRLGVDLDSITDKLQADGVAAFQASFTKLMDSIAEKQQKLAHGWVQINAELGQYQTLVDEALSEMNSKHILGRIWEHDYTVWSPHPTEITNRLGWLRIPKLMRDAGISRLHEFVESVTGSGYTHAVLLGMGGSSLAPEVFRKTFGVRPGYLDLTVLDSTVPGAVLDQANQLDYSKTLFIVATKSGGTVETLSFFKFFYNQVADTLGKEHAGEHFIAITDPGSSLVGIANQYHFRATFINDPNIGGRYSALSYFGLLPAALIGVNLEKLLDRALTQVCNSENCNNPVDGNNSAAFIGAILGQLALNGRDKLTIFSSPEINGFGDWLEQLIAESTGKNGLGILPVVGESPGTPINYGNDRLFVYLQLNNEKSLIPFVSKLIATDHPVVRVHLQDRYDIGAQFFLWELATALAGYQLGINPFDQPNVESAKVLARQMVNSFQKDGQLPVLEPTFIQGEITGYADFSASTLEQAIATFLSDSQPGSYISIQAYLNPSEAIDNALQALRTRLRKKTQLATTIGYGPRFLHSTGQLHKGDAGKGLFIQITSQPPTDINIPEEAGSPKSYISFGVLNAAQALGDHQALVDGNRKIIRFHIVGDIAAGINTLTNSIHQSF